MSVLYSPCLCLDFESDLLTIHPSTCRSAGKESTCNAGDPGLIPGSGRSAGEGKGYPLQHSWASLVAQLVKNPPAMPETWVWSLGWKDPLEKGKATHSSILAWRILGVTKSQTRLSNFHFQFTFLPSTHSLGVGCELGFSPQHPSPLPKKPFYDLRKCTSSPWFKYKWLKCIRRFNSSVKHNVENPLKTESTDFGSQFIHNSARVLLVCSTFWNPSPNLAPSSSVLFSRSHFNSIWNFRVLPPTHSSGRPRFSLHWFGVDEKLLVEDCFHFCRSYFRLPWSTK